MNPRIGCTELQKGCCVVHSSMNHRLGSTFIWKGRHESWNRVHPSMNHGRQSTPIYKAAANR